MPSTWFERFSADGIAPAAPSSQPSYTYGAAIALSPDAEALLVGDPLGNAKLYQRRNGQWVSLQTFTPGFPHGQRFGSAVAMNSTVSMVAVGAPADPSSAAGINGDQADRSMPFAGAVFIFRRVNERWEESAYIKASNPQPGAGFGGTLSLTPDGLWLAVGADGEGSNATGIDGDQLTLTAQQSGAVYLFEKTASGWVQRAYVKASNTWAGDHFGTSVSLSADGRSLAVGSRDESVASAGVNASQGSALRSRPIGAVYLFSRSSATWVQTDYIKPSPLAAPPWPTPGFGGSVSLSAVGSVLAVGSPHESSMYLFERGSGGWGQTARFSELGSFGMSVGVSADNNSIVVGAPYDDANSLGLDAPAGPGHRPWGGAAHIYRRSGASWVKTNIARASDQQVEGFGSSVAISIDGAVIAAGSPRFCLYTFPGMAYWYRLLP